MNMNFVFLAVTLFCFNINLKPFSLFVLSLCQFYIVQEVINHSATGRNYSLEVLEEVLGASPLHTFVETSPRGG